MRPPAAPTTTVADYEGRVVHRAVQEVEARRRWRSIIVWAVSLSLCAGFGWLAILAALSGPDAFFVRVRTNALVAFLTSGLALLAIAHPRPARPSIRRLRLIGGIVYLSALGGLILLGTWLALLAFLIQIGGGAPPDGSALGRVAWVWPVSAVIMLTLGSGLTAALLRLTPGAPPR